MMFEAVIIPVLLFLGTCGAIVALYKDKIREIDAVYKEKLRQSWQTRNEVEDAAFIAQLTRERLFREYCKVDEV